MSDHVVVITGGNRGIGKGLVAEYLLRTNHTVIAAIRDPTDQSNRDLDLLPKGTGSKFITLKIEATSGADANAAINELQAKHKLDRVDLLIANAGISNNFSPALGVPLKEVSEHFAVNAMGPLILVQAFASLLKSSKNPEFVAITTGLATIGGMGDIPPLPVTAYGASKAALNYIVRKIHFENEWLISFVMSRGWVQTDMGNAGAVANGMEHAPVTLKESIEGMVRKIDAADRATGSGSFMSFDEEKYPWQIVFHEKSALSKTCARIVRQTKVGKWEFNADSPVSMHVIAEHGAGTLAPIDPHQYDSSKD